MSYLLKDIKTVHMVRVQPKKLARELVLVVEDVRDLSVELTQKEFVDLCQAERPDDWAILRKAFTPTQEELL